MTGPAVVTEQLHIEDVPSGPAIKRAVHILIGPRVRVNRAEAELWDVAHFFPAAARPRSKRANPISPRVSQLTGVAVGVPLGVPVEAGNKDAERSESENGFEASGVVPTDTDSLKFSRLKS